MILDEYDILKKKSKKKGFAAFDLLIYIAIVLLAIIIFAFIIGKVNKSKTAETNNGSKTTSVITENNGSSEVVNKESNEVVTIDPKAERAYYENIKNIKDAAVNYFTNERLPKTKGETTKLTLKKMQDKKLVLNVIDSKDNLCDGEKSYVEVTKDTNEYVMKVHLSCSDKEDYIVVHLGCYDYCKDNICEKQEDVKEFEYEYKKVTECVMTDWSSWSEWKTKRETTNNNKKEETKTETKRQESIDTINATKSPVTYNCNDYPGYKLSGNLCIKETTTKEVIDATPSDYSYSCSDYPGYSIEGDKCVKTTTKTETKNATVIEGSYYCKEGYKLNGTKCERKITKTDTKDATKNPLTYYCPEGYKLNGTKCEREITKTDTKDATKNPLTYYCPAGYKLNGTKCERTITKTDTQNATANYGTRKESYTCYKQECTTKSVFSCASGTCKMVPQTSCEKKATTCYRDVSYVSGYSCPSGYNLIGKMCAKTYDELEKINATANPQTYSCPNGYTLSGTKCTKTYNEIEKIDASKNPQTYSCPEGYTLNGTKCTKQYDEIEKIDASKYSNTYKCDTGYILDGTKCTKTITEKDTKDAKKVSGGYICKSGYIQKDKKCERTITSIDTKLAHQNKVIYTCPEGYTLNGTKCTKKIIKDIKITYYRYATRSCNGGSTDTKWSYLDNEELLSDGYKLTGNKREIKSTVKEK